ncbi:MAG TPA: hypothetical protein VKE69_12340, partial [Planctomycetota bacterium]|nr:hypothetical protein [Planctomycetota bacterium]
IPWVAGFDYLKREDQQETDAHPNARCARAIAWRLARFLLERRWIPGAGERPLAPEDERYVSRIAPISSAAELAAEGAAWDRANAENVNPKIDFGDGVGWQQIYGGVWPDGTVGEVAFCVVARSGGARIAVALDPVQGRPSLYPLRVRVAVQGKDVGAIEIPSLPRERVERVFALPPELQREPFLEIELTSSNWIVEATQGVSRRAAFRLASVASAP